MPEQIFSYEGEFIIENAKASNWDAQYIPVQISPQLVDFADKIESVLVDGDDYSDFDSHILNTLEGKHTYHVFLKIKS